MIMIMITMIIIFSEFSPLFTSD